MINFQNCPANSPLFIIGGGSAAAFFTVSFFKPFAARFGQIECKTNVMTKKNRVCIFEMSMNK